METDSIVCAILQRSIDRLVDVRDMLKDDMKLEYAAEVDDVLRLLSLAMLRKTNSRKSKT